jgi:hypothetical protein
MCIDYTNLNKACPKDPYPFPRIDQIVDSTSGCELLSFIDAYSGFHQIKISKADRKHTASVTVDGLYCYVVMPHRLLNALLTFSHAMNITLGDLIRQIVEVYVDDIIVKTREANSLLENLAREMCLWCFSGEAPRVPGVTPGDRGKPGQDPGNRSNEAPCSTQGRAEVNGVACSP